MNIVFASDFASLEDLEKFKEAKEKGFSDQEAFKVGDNGMGCWGDVTATEEKGMCALPYEDWHNRYGVGAKAWGAKVKVTLLDENKNPVGEAVALELRDTMPHKANCENGCLIDLNPGALKLLGLVSPVKQLVGWEWE